MGRSIRRLLSPILLVALTTIPRIFGFAVLPEHRHALILLRPPWRPSPVTRRWAAPSSDGTPTTSQVDSSNDSSNDSSSSNSPAEMAISAIGSTTSMVVSITFFAVLAYRRDAFMVSFFIGSISNGILSKLLKKLLNQRRPDMDTNNLKFESIKPSDGGMPSSHAMSLGFIGTFVGLQISSWTLQAPLAAYVIMSLFYRIQVQLHTWQQVAVGLVVGSANAVLYYNQFHQPVMAWLDTHILQDGVLPWPLLCVPMLVGAIVVGSFERRLSAWISKHGKDDK